MHCASQQAVHLKPSPYSTHLPAQPLCLCSLCFPLLICEWPLVASTAAAAAAAADSHCGRPALHELHRRGGSGRLVGEGAAGRHTGCRRTGRRNACSRHAITVCWTPAEVFCGQEGSCKSAQARREWRQEPGVHRAAPALVETFSVRFEYASSHMRVLRGPAWDASREPPGRACTASAVTREDLFDSADRTPNLKQSLASRPARWWAETQPSPSLLGSAIPHSGTDRDGMHHSYCWVARHLCWRRPCTRRRRRCPPPAARLLPPRFPGSRALRNPCQPHTAAAAAAAAASSGCFGAAVWAEP